MSEVINIKELNERIERESVFVDTLRAEMRTFSDKLTEKIGGQAMQMDELLDEKRLQMRLAAMESRDDSADAREKLRALAAKAAAVGGGIKRLAGERFFGAGRLVRAFPDMRGPHSEALATLRSSLPDK